MRDLPAGPRATAEQCLSDGWDHDHIENERDEDGDDSIEIRNPHGKRVIAIEGLLEEGDEESSPDEDKSGRYSADHREAEQDIHKVVELASKRFSHQERYEDGAKERRHAVEDEG